MKRLEYIDAIKGFAILLVVMGHVLAWMFSDSSHLGDADSPSLLWKVIYSFHMPLFIFCSGFLFGLSKFETFGEYLTKLCRKARMLLVPYVVCGFLVFMWRGVRPFTYWYLLTLFQLILLVGFVLYFVDKIENKRIGVVLEVIALGALHLVIQYVSRNCKWSFLYCYDWFPHLSSLSGYFIIGCFISRHLSIEKLMNNYVYSACLIFFVASFVFSIPHTRILSVSLVSLAAIYAVFYMFKESFCSGKVVDCLRFMGGGKTLYIYIFHFFFDIQIVQFGEYFTWLSGTGKMGFVTCFVLQLLYSVVVSFVVIKLSLFAANLVKTSKFLSFAMLGE